MGGGNSAGQAAVFLRDFAAKVWMLVRGPNLAGSMSQYLINRIASADNIEVLTETEITVLSGSPEGQLECVLWRNRVTGAEREKPIRNVFIFIGLRFGEFDDSFFERAFFFQGAIVVVDVACALVSH